MEEVDFLLSGEPVKFLTGAEFSKKEGETFTEQVLQYFITNGCIANSAFEEVILDKKGIQNSKSHGMSRVKAVSFAAINDILESGVVILPMGYYSTNKREKTGVIAAPITIANERYICVVIEIANLENRKLYVHESFLTKNLQAVAASSSIHSREHPTSSQPIGDVAKVLNNFLTTKYEYPELYTQLTSNYIVIDNLTYIFPCKQICRYK